VSAKERSRDLLIIQHSLDTISHPVPDWLSVNGDGREVTVLSLPDRAQIDTSIREQMIVELYSK
jgi:small subunit ribosomal protein S4